MCFHNGSNGNNQIQEVTNKMQEAMNKLRDAINYINENDFRSITSIFDGEELCENSCIYISKTINFQEKELKSFTFKDKVYQLYNPIILQYECYIEVNLDSRRDIYSYFSIYFKKSKNTDMSLGVGKSIEEAENNMWENIIKYYNYLLIDDKE